MDDDLTMDVDLVGQLLTERDMTWADLARAMNMSKSSISRVQRYETRPGRKFIFALRDVFPAHRDRLFIPYAGADMTAQTSER